VGRALGYVTGALEVAGGAVTGILAGWTGVGAVGAAVMIASGLATIAASALSRPPEGSGIGTTSSIGMWNYAYGDVKVAGVKIFQETNSSQGTSHNDELHRVYAVACHPTEAFIALYLNGQLVNLISSGTNIWDSASPTQTVLSITSITVSSGVATVVFSGSLAALFEGQTMQFTGVGDNTLNGKWVMSLPNPADLTTWEFNCGGSNRSTSGGSATTTIPNYSNKIHVEFLNGLQTSTFPGLLASNTSWAASDLCIGHSLVYVRMGWDSDYFPTGVPEGMSFLIQGKIGILDPDSGTRGYATNPALCLADWLSIPSKWGGYGLTIASSGGDLNTADISAAKAVCNQSRALASGGTSNLYTCNYQFTLEKSRGTIAQEFLSSCAGRLLYFGGVFKIVPGQWAAPVASFTSNDFVGPVKFKPRFSVSETCNGVKGVYISPANNYQPYDFPAYMQDPTHGFVSDEWLAEDGGERIFKDVSFPATNLPGMAQWLAKIELMRIRYQMRCTVVLGLKAYKYIPLDVITLTVPTYTWSAKQFEIQEKRWSQGPGGAWQIEFDLAELDGATTAADSAIYGWSPTEELTPNGYVVPNNVGTRVAMPPEQVTDYSGPGATINGYPYPNTSDPITGASRIFVRWLAPNDANVVNGGDILIQWKKSTDTTYGQPVRVPALNNQDAEGFCSYYLTGIQSNTIYDVQVASQNAAKVTSVWITASPAGGAASNYPLAQYSGIPIASGAVTAQATVNDGTAEISIANFTNLMTGLSETVSGSPLSTDDTGTSIAQSVLYFVYYDDPTFLATSITPAATKDEASVLNTVGRMLIGTVSTPSFSPRYQPSKFSDIGTYTTVNPAAAYDNNLSTDAVVTGLWRSIASGSPPTFTYVSSAGDCQWSGFPAIILGASATLYVVANFTESNTTTYSALITVNIAGSVSTVVTFTSSPSGGTFPFTVPSGTDLSTVVVEAVANPTPGSSPGSGTVSIQGFEIYIQ
jgi:hypothetical protein